MRMYFCVESLRQKSELHPHLHPSSNSILVTHLVHSGSDQRISLRQPVRAAAHEPSQAHGPRARQSAQRYFLFVCCNVKRLDSTLKYCKRVRLYLYVYSRNSNCKIFIVKAKARTEYSLQAPLSLLFEMSFSLSNTVDRSGRGRALGPPWLS